MKTKVQNKKITRYKTTKAKSRAEIVSDKKRAAARVATGNLSLQQARFFTASELKEKRNKVLAHEF